MQVGEAYFLEVKIVSGVKRGTSRTQQITTIYTLYSCNDFSVYLVVGDFRSRDKEVGAIYNSKDFRFETRSDINQ